MGEKLEQFSANVKAQLQAAQDGLASVGERLKEAGGAAREDINAKWEAAKAQHEVRMNQLAECKAKCEASLRAKKEDIEADIAEWKKNREVNKLEKRAEKAEDYAIAAIGFAAAAILEADAAALEALAARSDADAAKEEH